MHVCLINELVCCCSQWEKLFSHKINSIAGSITFVSNLAR